MAKGKDREVRADAESEESDSSPRVYELGFHLNPDLPIEEMRTAYQEIRSGVERVGTIIAEGEPEKIQLAYTISKQDTAGRHDFNSAYFSWIVYETSTEGHAKVVTSASADSHIIRFIDFVTTKELARHALEIREISLKASARLEESEVATGAELDVALQNATA